MAVHYPYDLMTPVVMSGTGSGTVYDNTLTQLVRGDDYVEANSRQLVFTGDDPGNIATPGTAVCRFGAYYRHDSAVKFLVEGTVSIADGVITLAFDLPGSATANLPLGKYVWSAEVVDDSGNEITIARVDDCGCELVAQGAVQ